jgi:hypothetical protein
LGFLVALRIVVMQFEYSKILVNKITAFQSSNFVNYLNLSSTTLFSL